MKPRALILACACSMVLALPASAQEDGVAGGAVQVGDRCVKGDVPPRPGLVCLPAFVTINQELREEWEYESSYVLNARKGDAILSAGCELIGNLLREVNPEQRFSHAGIMVEDRHRIRHSTASVDWLMNQKAGSPPGSEGLLEKALKHAWPGTITQWVDEALEGALVKDPQTNDYYELKSFNPTPVTCPESGQTTPDTILKPPPLIDADPGTGARARLIAAATAAENIEGHYRFFGYSQPAAIMYSQASVPGNWADETVGSVCSAFVWRSMKDAGFTLEGSVVEPDDVFFRGAAVDALTADGLYIYTIPERAAAADFIYNAVGDLVAKEVSSFEDLLADVSDDLGNQLVNCFGFDWCGPTFSVEAGLAGCDPGDTRAQDSECWKTEGPGVGRAVSPDNMLNWDPAPFGPYGYREDLSYALGGYHRVYRWRAAAGTGTLQGVITDGGTPRADVAVILPGFAIADFTDGAGAYRMEAVPGGPATVTACAGGRGRSAIVTIDPGQTATRNLALGDGCDQAADPGKFRRNVRVQGTVKIVDTEDFGSDEIDTWTLDDNVTVEPNTSADFSLETRFFNWTECTGGEVRARITVSVRLNTNDLSVDVTITSRMFEGDSCSDDDLDATHTKTVKILANGSTTVGYVMESDEWMGEDTVHVNLVIENEID